MAFTCLDKRVACHTGWTVSDANLTPQKHWLSFLQRNLIGNEILKINSNQNTDAFHKKAEVSKRKVLFSFCTCISKSKNPHQIPGNRISSIFTLILKPFFQKLQNRPIYPSSALKRLYKYLRISLISLTQNMKDTPIIRVHVDGKYDPNKDYSQDYTRRSKIRLQVILIMQKF